MNAFLRWESSPIPWLCFVLPETGSFVSIAACAAADMCFLIVELVLSFETVILTVTCDYPRRIRRDIFLPVAVVSWFTANGHMALLAVVRYVILVYPIKAKVYLSTRRVLLLSVLVWTIAFLSSFGIGLQSFLMDTSPRASYKFHLALWTTMYLTPGTITVMLHLVKIYKIRQTTTVTTNEQAQRRVRVMSRMVLLVIFVGTVLLFPFVLDKFLQTFGKHIYGTPAPSPQVKYSSHLLVLVNHSINPVMYAFVSDAFRMSLKRMLGLDRNVSNGWSSRNETPLSTLSDIQRREDLLQRITD